MLRLLSIGIMYSCSICICCCIASRCTDVMAGGGRCRVRCRHGDTAGDWVPPGRGWLSSETHTMPHTSQGSFKVVLCHQPSASHTSGEDDAVGNTRLCFYHASFYQPRIHPGVRVSTISCPLSPVPNVATVAISLYHVAPSSSLRQTLLPATHRWPDAARRRC